MSSNEHVVNDQPPSPTPLNQTLGLNKNNYKSVEGNAPSSLNKSAVGLALIDENNKSSSVVQ